MEIIYIEPTTTTPSFYFNPMEGVIELRGVSSTERSHEFYHTITDKLERYLVTSDRAITANLSFDYFNASSSKCLFDLFKRFIRLRTAGTPLTVNWFYKGDDDDMRGVGEDYASVFDVGFNFIERSN